MCDYKVISETSLEDLESEVVRLMTLGYKVSGNLVLEALNDRFNTVMYHQPMVRNNNA